MFMIDFYDDDRNHDLSIGPFPERPTPEQAVSAILKEIKEKEHSLTSFAWCSYDIGDLKSMPDVTYEAKSLARDDYNESRNYGYVSLNG